MSIVLDGTTGLAGAATGALNGTLGATTPSTVAATTVVASSTIKGATTIAVGNATPSASGAGITFPATQSASTDANTLDDYEEGTFTPAIIGGVGGGSAGTGTYTAQAGRYTKTGNLVNFSVYINWTAHTGTGNMGVVGLPFATLNAANTYPTYLVYPYNIALTAGKFMIAAGDINSTSIYLYQIPTGGGADAPVPIDTSGSIQISGAYFTA